MSEAMEGLPDAVLDRLPLGVQILDENGLTIRVNDAFLRIFGANSAAQVVGVVNPLHEPSMRAQGITPYVERAYKGETVQTPLAPFRSPLGPTRNLRSDIVPLKDATGAVRRVILLIEDRSEQQASAHALERRYRQIAVLGDSFQRIAAHLSTDAVLESVLDAMRRLEQGEACAVWRVDPDGRWTCAASSGLSDEYRREVEILYAMEPIRSQLLGGIVRDNHPIVIEDTRTEPIHESLRELLTRENVRRMLAVPMRSGDSVIGSLGFYGRAPGAFDGLDTETASLLADQAAVALQNAQHYERAREAAAEAQVLNRIAAILTEPSSLSEVLRSITESIAPLMGVKRVAVNTVDQAAGTTTLIAYTGLDPETLVEWGVDQPRPLSQQHPIIQRMIESGEPLALDSIGDDLLEPLDEQQREAVEAFGIRSILVVPMYEDGRLIGTMSFDEPGEPRTWTERDVRLAQGLAAQAGVAIRNARLADEARAMREWLEEKVEERTEELRAAHAEVMATEKLAAVGFMSREVAHGLRNPLNVISTSLYYLKSRFPQPDEKIARHFDAIARSVEQAANTITQLMNLAGSRRPDMAPVDLNQLAQRAIEERRAVGDFRWVAQWDTTLPFVRGDWTQISHATKALIAYAAGPGGIVHIRTFREGERAILAVGDDRPPLTEEQRVALFQPFFASATEWTGLGLSVARQIALKHDGDLTVSDTDGMTWVRIELPLVHAEG